MCLLFCPYTCLRFALIFLQASLLPFYSCRGTPQWPSLTPALLTSKVSERSFAVALPVNRDWWLISLRIPPNPTIFLFFWTILTSVYSILHPHFATSEFSHYFILCISVISNCPSCWHHCGRCGQSRDGQEGNFRLFFLLFYTTTDDMSYLCIHL